MNKRNVLIVVGAVIVLIIALGAYFVNEAMNPKGYSVVYLSNGELYVGRLATFPELKLHDGYIFQAVPDTADPNKKNFQINPLTDALWAPEYVSFNKGQVLFYGPLLEESQIFQTIKNSVK